MGGAIEPPDDRLDRIDLFDAVLGALTELAGDRWVALVVEDVHWAEQATRDLLGFLLARIFDARVVLGHLLSQRRSASPASVAADGGRMGPVADRRPAAR